MHIFAILAFMHALSINWERERHCRAIWGCAASSPEGFCFDAVVGLECK